MRGHILLLTGALAFVGCENATEPTPAGPSAHEAAPLAAIDPGPASGSPVFHHFQLKSEGEFVPLGWCDESAGLARAAAPGEGTMTHVGRFEIEQSGCIDLATGQVTDGLGVLTAANGDEIHLAYAGSAVEVAPLTYELHYITTGGTGRFASAEGESDFVVVYTSETTWVAEGGGWIRYSASDRADR